MPHEGAGLLPALFIDQGQLPPATKQGEAMNIQILPLAITMMAGPQIMSAIIFVTAPKPVKVSASFIASVAIATTFGVAIALAVVTLLGNSITLGDSSDSGSTGHTIQYLLVGALVTFALKSGLVLQFTGHQVSMLRVSLLTSPLLFVLAIFVATMRYGPVGVAAAAALTTSLQNVILVLLAKRKSGMWTHVSFSLFSFRRDPPKKN
jgi:hypothetical protein